jgi:hypothetical protein
MSKLFKPTSRDVSSGTDEWLSAGEDVYQVIDKHA